MNGLLTLFYALQRIPVILINNHLQYISHLQLGSGNAIGFFGSSHAIDHVLLQSKKLCEGRNHQGGFPILDRSNHNTFCGVDDCHAIV